MRDEPALRLGITGAPRTGKTTVSTALSLATGLLHSSVSADLLHLRSDRELAPTVEMALRGFERRLDSEARMTSGFISDGSVFNEWALAETRRRTRPLTQRLNPRGIPFRAFEKQFLIAHSAIVSRRANLSYDAFVHLRIDPETGDDDDFRVRQLTDRLLLKVLHEAEIPYLVVGGSLEEIVTRITGLCRLPQLVPIADAVSAASVAA